VFATVASRLGITENYLSQVLPQLADTGWLLRLRRGLYASTGRFLNEIEVHPFAIATHLVTPSAISHWSALHAYGLTDQVPHMVTAFTPKKIVTLSMRGGKGRTRSSKHAWEVEGLRYEYVSVKPEHFFGIEEMWVDQRFKVPITDTERTLLEGFISPRRFGGIGEVLSILAARERRILQPVVEQDYTFSYVLAGLASQPSLAETLLLSTPRLRLIKKSHIVSCENWYKTHDSLPLLLVKKTR